MGFNEVGLLHEARGVFYLALHRPLEGETFGEAFLLQAVGRKRRGSHDEMEAVVERFASGEDTLPSKVGLRARALIERWLRNGHMSDDPATRFRGQMTFSLEEKRERILRLDDDYRRLASVWCPAETDPFGRRLRASQHRLRCPAVQADGIARPHVVALSKAPGE